MLVLRLALAAAAAAASASPFTCDLPEPVDPAGDGLPPAHHWFSSRDALELQARRHQALVQVPTVCVDDADSVWDDDGRWEPFERFRSVLADQYPMVHHRADVEEVNRFGLVYTIRGGDETLQPILLTAHQDVVPVDDGTLDEWEHPPFSGHFDGEQLWGRGAVSKGGVGAVMTVLETLLASPRWEPARTVVLAMGFDEECAGSLGAAHMSPWLEDRYGRDGVAVVVDVGGGDEGLVDAGDALYALPAVYEKGYLDVWFDLDVVGGHSATPPPRTAIGIMSDVVTAVEAHEFAVVIQRDGPVHHRLLCLARYSPDAAPELTRAIRADNLTAAAAAVEDLDDGSRYYARTTRAVDFVAGGGPRLNALPEFVTLGVNHRYAPQDSAEDIKRQVLSTANSVAGKHGLSVHAFEDDYDVASRAASGPRPHPRPGAGPRRRPVPHVDAAAGGSLVLRTGRKASAPSPVSPTEGAVWDLFAGTIRHTFASRGTVVPAGTGMAGNTDARHYAGLSKNIYRWSPGSRGNFTDAHVRNERVSMASQMDVASFYYDLIRVFTRGDAGHFKSNEL